MSKKKKPTKPATISAQEHVQRQEMRKVADSISDAMRSLREVRELVRLLVVDFQNQSGRVNDIDHLTVLDLAEAKLNASIAVLVTPYEGTYVEQLAAFTCGINTVLAKSTRDE